MSKVYLFCPRLTYWFKVYWDGNNFPKAINECDGLCQVVEGDACLCGTTVSKSRGFGGVPSSLEEILEKLFIGFPDPNIFNSDSYTPTYDPQTGVTTHVKDGSFDSSTVFEFSDNKGRQFFIKNSVETVQVRSLDNGYTGYSFRNAPQFMSFVPTGECSIWRTHCRHRQMCRHKFVCFMANLLLIFCKNPRKL